MCDIFLKSDALNLLKAKHVIFFGDSNMRRLYKDVVWLANENSLISETSLRKKLELSFQGDRLVKWTELHKGRDFEEVRKFKTKNVQLEYFFITKCYNDKIVHMIEQVKAKKTSAPDVIIMNSCLWDITRWGPNGVTMYKDNMVKLMQLFKASLPPKTLVIWTTAPPVSTTCYGPLLVKQVEFMQHTLRFEVMEANMFARQLVVAHGFDVLDIHHHLRMQIHKRCNDGIHWQPQPIRHMTNLLLTHIALSWGHTLPGNFQGPILESIKKLENEEKTEIVFPSLPFKLVEDKPKNDSTADSKAKIKKNEVPISLSKLKKKARKPRASKSARPPPLFYNNFEEMPLHMLNKENIPNLFWTNNFGESVVPPSKPIVMYNNYGEPIFVSDSYYRMLHGGWRQSVLNRQQRRTAPYYF